MREVLRLGHWPESLDAIMLRATYLCVPNMPAAYVVTIVVLAVLVFGVCIAKPQLLKKNATGTRRKN